MRNMRKMIVALMVLLTAGLSFVPTRAQAQEGSKESTAAPQAQPKLPVESYRLDFSFNEVLDGKIVNTRHYSLNLTGGESNEVKIGTKVPVSNGSGSQFQYMDVGTSVWAQLREHGDQWVLVVRGEVSNLDMESGEHSGNGTGGSPNQNHRRHAVGDRKTDSGRQRRRSQLQAPVSTGGDGDKVEVNRSVQGKEFLIARLLIKWLAPEAASIFNQHSAIKNQQLPQHVRPAQAETGAAPVRNLAFSALPSIEGRLNGPAPAALRFLYRQFLPPLERFLQTSSVSASPFVCSGSTDGKTQVTRYRPASGNWRRV